MNPLKKYLEYTKEHESREIYHTWCFISAVASILSGRCWTTLGYSILHPNFFVILSGPPGIPRKSAAIKTITDLCQPVIDEGFLNLASESLTKPRLCDELVEGEQSYKYTEKGEELEHKYMSLLTIASELSSFVKPKDDELSKFLLNLFDGEKKYDHGTRHHGTAKLKNATLNILAATTTEFFEGLSFQEHVRSGLSSRCIFLQVDDRKFNKPDPQIDFELKEDLREDLMKLTEITGYIKFSDHGRKFFNSWYEAQPITVIKGTPKNMLSYCARRQTYVRKLSLILWSLDYIKGNFIKEICEVHVKNAIELITEAENYMVAAYGKSGRSPDIEAINDVIAFFQAHEGEWVARQQLVYRFAKEMKPEVLDYILHNLAVEVRALEVQMLAGRPMYKFIGLGKVEEEIDNTHKKVNKSE